MIDRISEQAIAKASDSLSVADLGSEAIILDPVSGQYFGVNHVGVFIVEQLNDAQKVATLIDSVAGHFGIARDVASHDVVSFLQELVGADLVELDVS